MATHGFVPLDDGVEARLLHLGEDLARNLLGGGGAAAECAGQVDSGREVEAAAGAVVAADGEERLGVQGGRISVRGLGGRVPDRVESRRV